jgi:hypothetical protein
LLEEAIAERITALALEDPEEIRNQLCIRRQQLRDAAKTSSGEGGLSIDW